MIIDTFRQQPGESKQRNIDGSRWLKTGETFVSVVTSSELASGDADDSGNPFTITGAVVASGTLITYFAAGGADSNNYKATFKITTTVPQLREDEVMFRIRED